MTDQEQKEHLKEYSDRHRFWANQALNQFGYSINLFTTLGIALLTFLVNQKSNFSKITFDISKNIDYSLIFYIIALVCAGLIVIFGLLSVTARLYDIRITRHIIWTRKRAMKKLKTYLPEGFIDLTKANKISNYFRTLIRKIKWIEAEHFNEKTNLIERFEALRKQAKLLGELSWKAHKFQLLTLLLTLIFYGLARFL